MNRSLVQLALFSLLLASTTPITPVHAQVDFSDIQPGMVAQDTNDLRQLQTTLPAEIVITTPDSSATSLEVSPPVWVSGPIADPFGTQTTATVQFNGVSIDSNSNKPASLPVGNTRIEVFMQVQRPDIFPAGSYSYQVELITTTNPL